MWTIWSEINLQQYLCSSSVGVTFIWFCFEPLYKSIKMYNVLCDKISFEKLSDDMVLNHGWHHQILS